MQIFIGIVFLIISICTYIFAGNVGAESDTRGSGICLLATMFFVLGIILIHLGKPSAMDVYRGKTTLQITYKNNVPIDSTVVYK